MSKQVILCISILIIVVLAIVSAAGCETRLPDKSTPTGAFSRLSRCVDTASTGCLFRELDNKTRWTVSSIHKILRETRRTVEESYPDDERVRNAVYGKWHKESAAETDVEMFDILCSRHACLKKLARGFAAVKEEKITADVATITTVRGETFHLKKSNGKWGIVLLSDVIDGEAVRLSDSLKQVRRNAKEYEQQRLATGKTH